MGMGRYLSGKWITVVALAGLLPAVLTAQTTAPAPNLERLMSQINRSYRTIRTNVADKSKNAATILAVEQMQTATVAAKGVVPSTVSSLPQDQQPAKLNQYRKEMLALLKVEIELEDTLLADDNAKAADLVKQMDDLQKQGHADFRPRN